MHDQQYIRIHHDEYSQLVHENQQQAETISKLEAELADWKLVCARANEYIKTTATEIITRNNRISELESKLAETERLYNEALRLVQDSQAYETMLLDGNDVPDYAGVEAKYTVGCRVYGSFCKWVVEDEYGDNAFIGTRDECEHEAERLNALHLAAGDDTVDMEVEGNSHFLIIDCIIDNDPTECETVSEVIEYLHDLQEFFEFDLANWLVQEWANGEIIEALRANVWLAQQADSEGAS